MTSVHMNSSESQTTAAALNGSLNQSQTTPSKYDEAERVRQRMESLRRHHAESSDIHNRTQPIIDEQIHEETVKYLKSNQVNGTKTKSQKPRAPKRQRTTANANATATATTTAPNNQINNNINSPPIIRSLNSANDQSHQLVTIQPPLSRLPHNISRQQQIPPIQQQQQQQQPPITQQQVPSQPQIIMQPGLQPMQQAPASYQPSHMQQPPMHTQHQQRPHQNQVNHQTYNGTYHPNQYQTPSMNYPQQHQSQNHHRPQQQQHHIPGNPNNHHSQVPISQGIRYESRQGYAQPNHHGYYQQTQTAANNYQQNQHVNTNHQNHVQLNSYMTLPNDLDLNLQAGLECDIDSLIKHEMSVEGQLEFNNDLLLKLDNHYQPNHQ